MARPRPWADMTERTQVSDHNSQPPDQPTGSQDLKQHNKSSEEDTTVDSSPIEPIRNKYLQGLITEAEAGYTLCPIDGVPEAKPETIPDESSAPNDMEPNDMEPNDPLPTIQALNEILTRLKASTNPAPAVEDSKLLEHEYNPNLIYHMIRGAPYTTAYCKRCNQHTPCPDHRQPHQNSTSVSLCAHMRMKLYWAVNNPCNDKGSWRLVVEDYTTADSTLVAQHRRCNVYKLGERAGLLAERVVEDMQLRGLRSTKRRVADEIYGLVGAWDRNAAKQKEKRLFKEEEEKKEREAKEAEKKRIQQQVEDALKKIKEARNQVHGAEFSKKRKFDAISPPHEEVEVAVTKKVKFDIPEAESKTAEPQKAVSKKRKASEDMPEEFDSVATKKARVTVEVVKEVAKTTTSSPEKVSEEMPASENKTNEGAENEANTATPSPKTVTEAATTIENNTFEKRSKKRKASEISHRGVDVVITKKTKIEHVAGSAENTPSPDHSAAPEEDDPPTPASFQASPPPSPQRSRRSSSVPPRSTRSQAQVLFSASPDQHSSSVPAKLIDADLAKPGQRRSARLASLREWRTSLPVEASPSSDALSSKPKKKTVRFAPEVHITLEVPASPEAQWAKMASPPYQTEKQQDFSDDQSDEEVIVPETDESESGSEDEMGSEAKVEVEHVDEKKLGIKVGQGEEDGDDDEDEVGSDIEVVEEDADEDESESEVDYGEEVEDEDEDEDKAEADDGENFEDEVDYSDGEVEE